jgi:hypothetical protein
MYSGKKILSDGFFLNLNVVKKKLSLRGGKKMNVGKFNLPKPDANITTLRCDLFFLREKKTFDFGIFFKMIHIR